MVMDVRREGKDDQTKMGGEHQWQIEREAIVGRMMQDLHVWRKLARHIHPAWM